MVEKKFNAKKLNKLNNPERIKEFPINQILKLTGIRDPEIIVDLGAGTGFFSIPFAKLFVNSKIYACDISDIMIDWMHTHIAGVNKNIIPLKTKKNKVPLDSGIADFLFMVNLHHELNDPEETLNECHRLLKPGGKIAISDWRKEKSDYGPSFSLRCPESMVERQLTNAGFQHISVYKNFPNNFLLIGEKRP